MKRWGMLLVAAVIITACVTYQNMALGDIKEGLLCLEYKEGIKWEQVTAVLGDADAYPKPGPGVGPDLSKNARVYKGAVVIFYVEPKEVIVDGKKRYKEVVYKIEVCKKK